MDVTRDDPVLLYPRFTGALSSVVEHYLHTVGVVGSKPTARTITRPAAGAQLLRGLSEKEAKDLLVPYRVSRVPGGNWSLNRQSFSERKEPSFVQGAKI